MKSCHLCSNGGDHPTGLHEFSCYNKPIHQFGCPIAASGSKEGCGGNICFNCDKTVSEEAEIEEMKIGTEKEKIKNNMLRSF